jgi:hypothetical protein
MWTPLKNQAKWWGWRLFLNAIPCSIEDTVVVAGVARSGTTWLAELVATLPGYKLMGEPPAYGLDRPDHVPMHQPPGSQNDELRSYLRDVMEGRQPGGWRLDTDSRMQRIVRHGRRRRMVTKFIHGNRLLQWLAGTFDIGGIVLIVRHPCAVVASMQKYGAWYYATPTDASPGLEQIEKGLPDSLIQDMRVRLPIRPKSNEEMLALRWALDHYIPFFAHAKAGYPWTLIPYEQLVADGPAVLERMFTYIGADVPPAAANRLSVASRSAQRTGVHAEDVAKQLSKWRRQLDSNQVDRILQIAHAFGLDFYDDTLEPDYERLLRFQRSGTQLLD